jgi:hypothetical protein
MYGEPRVSEKNMKMPYWHLTAFSNKPAMLMQFNKALFKSQNNAAYETWVFWKAGSRQG